MECIAMAEAIKACAVAIAIVGGAFAFAWMVRGMWAQ